MTKLRIGLDLRAQENGFKAHYGRGTGRYVSELVRELFAIQAGKEELPYEFVPASTESLGAGKLERRLYKLAPLGRNTLEQQILLPRRIAKQGVNLFHFFSHVDAPSRCAVPYLVTVLDLIPLKFPELYSANKTNLRFKFARYLELQAVRQARGIIAISEATKSDLVELLNINPQKIAVTPLAVGASFIARNISASRDVFEAEICQARREVGLDASRPVLLYVGGIDARKNVTFMLDAFAHLLRSTDSASRPQLLMIGRYVGDDNYPKLLSQIHHLNLNDDVQLRGFVDEETLIKLYHASTLVLFPSLYEGFGLPVLEAMACGVPVIAFRNSSIPEVVGDNSILVEKPDKLEWNTKIIEIMASIDRQIELSQLGVRRARHFSWSKTASMTIEAYDYFLKK
ncbi:MAG: glycosyltransferase family 4 protein [Deltaproteobacteria bacterium]|nr:glycosyltransferase family 4 protein [Deltaproteobacteria bacterium]